MGTAVTDLALMSESGATVSCATEDPSRWTATGVAAAVRAAVAHRGLELDGCRVLIQGAGHVGEALARILAADGATVLIADVDADRARAIAAELDGEVIDPRTRDRHPLRRVRPVCRRPRDRSREHRPAGLPIVAGAANDTLSHRADAELLAARGITYVPDFVANAGGVVHIHGLRMGWDEARMRREVLKIGDRAARLLETARRGRSDTAGGRRGDGRATAWPPLGATRARWREGHARPTATSRTRARWCCPASRRWCG